MTHEEKIELLIRVDERVERIETWCSNHMAHHQRLLYAFIGAAMSIILAEATMIVGFIVAFTRNSGQ